MFRCVIMLTPRGAVRGLIPSGNYYILIFTCTLSRALCCTCPLTQHGFEFFHTQTWCEKNKCFCLRSEPGRFKTLQTFAVDFVPTWSIWMFEPNPNLFLCHVFTHSWSPLQHGCGPKFSMHAPCLNEALAHCNCHLLPHSTLETAAFFLSSFAVWQVKENKNESVQNQGSGQCMQFALDCVTVSIWLEKCGH